jgi:hypothetical protein
MHPDRSATDLVRAYNALSSEAQWSGLSKNEHKTTLLHLTLSYKASNHTSVSVNLISSSIHNFPQKVAHQTMAIHCVVIEHHIMLLKNDWDLFVEVCTWMWENADEIQQYQVRFIKYIITCMFNVDTDKRRRIIAAHKKALSEMAKTYPLFRTTLERQLQAEWAAE